MAEAAGGGLRAAQQRGVKIVEQKRAKLRLVGYRLAKVVDADAQGAAANLNEIAKRRTV